jgi:hypothetical protein
MSGIPWLNRLRPNIIDFGFNRASPREIVHVRLVDLTPVKWSKNLTREQAFGEYMSKRKCLKEYDRIGTILNDE